MKEPVTYWRAQEVRDIAEELIPQFHEHIVEQEVRYLFQSKHSKSGTKARWEYVKKVGGLNAYLGRAHELESMSGTRPPAPVAHPFFLLVVAFDIWGQLTGPQRIALIDHELKHIGPDGETNDHDIEEFDDVVARHGRWRPNLASFLTASEQTPLFSGADPRRASETGASAEDVH
jgi:hypothetical protein